MALLLQGLLVFRQASQDDDAAIIAKEIAKSRQHYLQNASWQSDTN